MTLTEKEAPPAQIASRRAGTGPRGQQPDAGDPASRRAGPDHRRLPRPRLGLSAALHRHPVRHRHAARVRALHHGEAGRHEGDGVLRRLRAPAVVGPARRDRVRRQGHPRRRVRADRRVHLHRGGRRGGRAAGLPPAAVPPADHRGVRRLGHAPPHRPRPGPRPGLHLREGDEQLQRGGPRALAGEDDAGGPGRPAGRRHHRVDQREELHQSQLHDRRHQGLGRPTPAPRGRARRQAHPPDGHARERQGHHGGRHEAGQPRLPGRRHTDGDRIDQPARRARRRPVRPCGS